PHRRRRVRPRGRAAGAADGQRDRRDQPRAERLLRERRPEPLPGAVVSGPRPGRRSSATGRAWRRWPAELLAVLPALLTARLLVAASFVSAVVAADHLSPGGRPRELEQWLVGW